MKLTQSEENGPHPGDHFREMHVEHAAALREALLAATSPGKPVPWTLAEVEDADITLLQLLLATAQTLEKRGTGLSRQGALSPAVGEAARISGFDQTPRLKSFFGRSGISPAPAGDRAKPSGCKPFSPTRSGMAKRIMTVDDSASVRQMVAFTLKKEGYDVIEASDGKDALSKLAGTVDMVITDLNMPTSTASASSRASGPRPPTSSSPSSC